MALCRRTNSCDVFTWSGPCTPEDTITVTLASNTKIVFRGVEYQSGSTIAWPDFRLDPDASDQNAVRRLYDRTLEVFYRQQSRWWRMRHFTMRNLAWIKKHVEFGIQLDDYDSEINHKRTLAIGNELVVFFIVDGKQSGFYSSRIPYYIPVVGDISDALMWLDQEPERSSSTIVNIA